MDIWTEVGDQVARGCFGLAQAPEGRGNDDASPPSSPINNTHGALVAQCHGRIATNACSDDSLYTVTPIMLSAFTARPIVELKPRDKSKIESILAYGMQLS